MTFRIKWIAVFAVLIGIAAVALTTVNLASARGPSDPQAFKAELLTTSSITNEDCVFRGGESTVCDFDVTGDILGTLLGRGTVKANFSFDVAGILAGGCGEMIPNSGSVTWTSHTGDELQLRPVSSLNCSSGVNEVNIVGVHEIEGGTGMFRRASGSLAFTGESTPEGLVNKVVGEIRLSEKRDRRKD